MNYIIKISFTTKLPTTFYISNTKPILIEFVSLLIPDQACRIEDDYSTGATYEILCYRKICICFGEPASKGKKPERK